MAVFSHCATVRAQYAQVTQSSLKKECITKDVQLGDGQFISVMQHAVVRPGHWNDETEKDVLYRKWYDKK